MGTNVTSWVAKKAIIVARSGQVEATSGVFPIATTAVPTKDHAVA